MHTYCRSIFSISFLATAALAQLGTVVTLPPVPASPYEPITAGVQLLATPAARAMGLNLLNVAGQNYSFESIGAPAVVIATQLESQGQAKVEGTGTMEEIYTPGHSTWFSNFANVQSGRPYPLATNPVPLRVQMARTALLWPILGRPTIQQIRVAATALQGQPVTCVLVNAALATSLPDDRSWLENEYCLNSAGLLVLMSPKPGIYFLYDYGSALHFAGHTVAGTITAIEGTTTVLRIEVTGVGAPTASDLATLQQLPRGRPDLFRPTFINFHPHVRNGISTVVAMHFTVSADGTVQDAEVVPEGQPAAELAALGFIRQLRFHPARAQREVFGEVESH